MDIHWSLSTLPAWSTAASEYSTAAVAAATTTAIESVVPDETTPAAAEESKRAVAEDDDTEATAGESTEIIPEPNDTFCTSQAPSMRVEVSVEPIRMQLFMNDKLSMLILLGNVVVKASMFPDLTEAQLQLSELSANLIVDSLVKRILGLPLVELTLCALPIDSPRYPGYPAFIR